MPSNTSKGRGIKGSKFWIQTLVNLDDGNVLTKAIKNENNSISDIKWLSPIKRNNYAEFKTKQIVGLETADFTFWPDNGPWWDGVGIDDNGCILLVEAKGHVAETKTKCRATSPSSFEKIRQSTKDAHDILVSSISDHHIYNKDVWLEKYYQLANRLTFLVMLRKQGYNVMIVLLNLVEDSTHIATSNEEWETHYNEVFNMMLGTEKYPDNLVMVNIEVG